MFDNRNCTFLFFLILKRDYNVFVKRTKWRFVQGVSTAREVYEVLSHRGWLELFPLFATVHEISIGRLPPSAIVEHSEREPKFSLVEGST